MRARAPRALPLVKHGLCTQPGKCQASWVGDLRHLCAARRGEEPPEAAQMLEHEEVGLEGRGYAQE